LILQRTVPEVVYAGLWKLGVRIRASSRVHRAVFTRVYENNVWGNAESRSGPGSTRARGAQLRDALLDLVSRFSISSVLDAPCGDFNWMREALDERIASYIGVDIVERLIAVNRERHGASNRRFICCDLTRDPLPQADLIVCRDGLVHLSFTDIARAIGNFKRSRSTYLLATSFVDRADNVDTRTGGWRTLNMQAFPLGFPPPLASIDDIPPHARDSYGDKRLCLWELEAICRSPAPSNSRCTARRSPA